MCDLIALNFVGPTFYTIKRENQKGVRSFMGEQPSIFHSIFDIYVEGQKPHNIVGLIPCIPGEEKSSIKQRVAWESKFDILVGFCGLKVKHICVSNF